MTTGSCAARAVLLPMLQETKGVADTKSPRLNLKKRAASLPKDRAALATVNSAFLTGLFADVAKVQDDSSPASSAPLCIPESTPEHPEPSQPRKKARLSKNKSLGRSRRSFHILTEALSTLDTPHTSATFANVNSITPTSERDAISPQVIGRVDSLAYQLGCVSDSSYTDITRTSDAIKIAFPLLPTTVNDTPALPLARKVSDPQLYSERELVLAPKESYGWFIEMDADDHSGTPVPTSTTAPSNTDQLAFKAYTAPPEVNHDAEVEWAKAADTVDDVLGDLF